MPLFIRSDKDPEGRFVRVENAFRGSDGKYFLLLHRLPPEYAKCPTFLAELSGETMNVRGETGAGPVYHKAYAYQCLNAQELKLLRSAKPGKPVAPFLNFSYPNVLRILGKQFDCLSGSDAQTLASRYTWKLIGGMRS